MTQRWIAKTMKEETTAARDAITVDRERHALTRLKFFEDALEFAEMRVIECEARLKDERAVYAAARPLTEAERTKLAEHVAAGGALCCSDGFVWLTERLPAPWADAINGWAYKNLSCSASAGASEELRATLSKRVQALKLDRFP